jgi:hypothetical protein
MAIKTTINIHKDIMAKLIQASIILQIPGSRIIKILLQEYSERNHDVVMFSPVKYQKHDNKTNWQTFHLNLQGNEYEYYEDFRKIYKKSLSLIIAEAINKYLKFIIAKLKFLMKSNMDCHLPTNYLFFQRIEDGVICGTYFWGLPTMKTLQQYIT